MSAYSRVARQLAGSPDRPCNASRGACAECIEDALLSAYRAGQEAMRERVLKRLWEAGLDCAYPRLPIEEPPDE